MKSPRSNSNSTGKGLFIGGSMKVNLNGNQFLEVKAQGRQLSINVISPEYVHRISRAVPHYSGKMKLLRYISSLLEKTGFTLELDDSGKEFLTMGSGIHGLLGHFKVNPIRARRFL